MIKENCTECRNYDNGLCMFHPPEGIFIIDYIDTKKPLYEVIGRIEFHQKAVGVRNRCKDFSTSKV